MLFKMTVQVIQLIVVTVLELIEFLSATFRKRSAPITSCTSECLSLNRKCL